MSKKILKKLSICWNILKSRQSTKIIQISSENEARAKVEQILKTSLKVNTAENLLSLQNMADKIVTNLAFPEGKTTQEQLESILDGVLSQAFWYHSQLAGLTTVWEFRIRLFAARLGISPNVPIEQKTKKNKANCSIEHRQLSDTIRELDKVTSQRLNLKLLQLNDLRNGIIHCNPQSIRAYSIPLFGKDVLKPIRGNVVLINFQKNESLNMSDIQKESEIEDQDIFGWFLEVYNSGLPKKAFEAFSNSMKSLNLLIEFQAVSFSERRAVFENLMYKGLSPTSEDIETYEEYYQKSPHKTDAKLFFSTLLKSFRNLKKQG